MSALLGLPSEPDRVRVRREVSGGRQSRVDLLVDVDGHLATVVEVKVLSGLGRNQLARYDDAWPTAGGLLPGARYSRERRAVSACSCSHRAQ